MREVNKTCKSLQTDLTGAPRRCYVEKDYLSSSSDCCVRLEVLFVGAFVFFFVFAGSRLGAFPATVRDTCLVRSKHAEQSQSLRGEARHGAN
jgi:hypothetical protein